MTPNTDHVLRPSPIKKFGFEYTARQSVISWPLVIGD